MINHYLVSVGHFHTIIEAQKPSEAFVESCDHISIEDILLDINKVIQAIQRLKYVAIETTHLPKVWKLI